MNKTRKPILDTRKAGLAPKTLLALVGAMFCLSASAQLAPLPPMNLGIVPPILAGGKNFVFKQKVLGTAGTTSASATITPTAGDALIAIAFGYGGTSTAMTNFVFSDGVNTWATGFTEQVVDGAVGINIGVSVSLSVATGSTTVSAATYPTELKSTALQLLILEYSGVSAWDAKGGETGITNMSFTLTTSASDMFIMAAGNGDTGIMSNALVSATSPTATRQQTAYWVNDSPAFNCFDWLGASGSGIGSGVITMSVVSTANAQYNQVVGIALK